MKKVNVLALVLAMCIASASLYSCSSDKGSDAETEAQNTSEVTEAVTETEALTTESTGFDISSLGEISDAEKNLVGAYKHNISEATGRFNNLLGSFELYTSFNEDRTVGIATDATNFATIGAWTLSEGELKIMTLQGEDYVKFNVVDSDISADLTMTEYLIKSASDEDLTATDLTDEEKAVVGTYSDNLVLLGIAKNFGYSYNFKSDRTLEISSPDGVVATLTWSAADGKVQIATDGLPYAEFMNNGGALMCEVTITDTISKVETPAA